MKFLFLSCIAMLCVYSICAQNIFKAIIKNEEAKPLQGATVSIKPLHKSATADSSGLVIINNLPNGKLEITFSHVGFKEATVTFNFPVSNDSISAINFEEDEHEEGEVIVTSTRTSRAISDIPARVETISGEELAEKGNMKPGDIRMLLNESTGIQTQQTSATSYNSSIRIQGLDGRYTQILRDGFPLYSGFSGGLSLTQIAPLDLKQIEVIKGSSSTLYGGGAIAGLVNLISKTPAEKREINFLANGTSAGGLDVSGFYSQKFNKIGITIFGSRNSNKAYDPANIGLTAIPKFERYTINPRVFFYSDKTTANFGFSYITENRLGGSINYINKDSAGYFEKNNTDRFTTQAQLTHEFNDKAQIDFKNSYSRFSRFIQIPSYAFKGLQQSTYSEAAYNYNDRKMQWVAGANLLTDDFAEDKQSDNALRNYHYNTIGAFVQNTFSPSKQFTLETGLRGDYVKQYGFELLPRISALLKISSKLTTRLGGGLGYKTPTVFNEEAEKTDFQNILPVNQNTASDERSVGGNLDINYRTRLGNVGFALNQLFFYTRLNKPLVLNTIAPNALEFVNANGFVNTKGMETNLRFTYSDFNLFIGYTYADVNSHYNNIKSWSPLAARHRLNNVLVYEKEGKLKIGAEAYYYSPQQLNDGTIGKAYWTFGLMAEKIWKHFSIFINLENITDTRQTRFDSIYTGTISHPVFRDIYAPLDGFVANGGIKVKL